MSEANYKGVVSEGGTGAHERLVVSRLFRPEGRFECYLQYFRGSSDSTDMKDTSFQRGFWEAPESLLGIICEALECPAVFLGVFWSSPGVSQGTPWDVFGERPHCVFLYLVAIAGIFYLDILAYPGEIVFFDNVRSLLVFFPVSKSSGRGSF